MAIDSISSQNISTKPKIPPREEHPIPAAIDVLQQQRLEVAPADKTRYNLISQTPGSIRWAQAIAILPVALKLLKFVAFIGIAVGIAFLIANFVVFPPMLFAAIVLLTFLSLCSIHVILNQCLKRREKRFQGEMAIQIFKALRTFTTKHFKNIDKSKLDLVITALKIEPTWKGIPEFKELMGLLLSEQSSLSDLKRYNELYRSIFNANIKKWDTVSEFKNLSKFQQFFQKLGRAQELDVDGSPVFEKLGSEMLGTSETPTNMKEFSNVFKEMFKHLPIGTFHKDGGLKLRGIWWGLFHIKQLCESLQSKLLGVKHDQSFLCGLSSRVLKIGNVWIMRADGIFNPQKQMTFLDLRTDSTTHVHVHNLQSRTKAENARREYWDENVPNGTNLTTSSTSVNGPTWKSKEAPEDTATTAKYLDWYATEGIKTANVVPEILAKAIDMAKTAFATVIPDTQNKRRMLQFGVQTFVTQLEREKEDLAVLKEQEKEDLAVLKEQEKKDLAVPDLREGFYFSPCRQMVDRGATIETMMAILALLKTTKPETETLFNDIKIKSLAGLLMSGILLEGRAPNKERYQPFLDMLDFIADYPDAFTKGLTQKPEAPLAPEAQ
jgi:hypothetical protein